MHSTVVISRPVSTTSARLSLHYTRTVRACISIGSASLHNLASVNCWSITQRLHAVVCIAQWYTITAFRPRCYVLRLHRCWLLLTLTCKLFPSASTSCYFSYFLIPPLCFNYAPSSSSYFVILLRFPVLVPFRVKIHTLSRIMEQILIRMFVKTGLNMSSMNRAVKSKRLIRYACLSTQCIYVFHVTVTEEICYFLTQHE